MDGSINRYGNKRGNIKKGSIETIGPVYSVPGMPGKEKKFLKRKRPCVIVNNGTVITSSGQGPDFPGRTD
jgi:hypothetical protein